MRCMLLTYLLGLALVLSPLLGQATEQSDLARQAHALYEKGNTHYPKGTDQSVIIAFDYYQAGLELAKAAKDDSAMARGYYLFGAIYDKFNEIERAKYYYSKALGLFERISAGDWASQSYYALSNMCHKANQPDSADFYLYAAEEVARKHQANEQLFMIYKFGVKKNVEQRTLNLDAAHSYLVKLEALYAEIDHESIDHSNIDPRQALLEGRIFYYEGSQNDDRLLEALRAGIAHSQEHNRPYLKDYLYKIAHLHYKKGNADSAFFYMDSSYKFNKVYFDEKAREELAEMQKDYDLMEKRNKLEQREAQLATNKRVLFMLIGFLVVATVMLIAIYRLAHQRRRTLISLTNSEQEKTTLLQELHHRVKNNLQMLNTLLMLQSRKLTDPMAKAAVLESRARVETMSLAHRKLYDDKALSNVNLQEYLQELISSLTSTYLPEDAIVDVKVQKRWCSADFAIPIGLIVNELVTNSIKHATPEDDRLAITVEIRQPGLDRLQMIYQDNGPGMPLTDHSQSNSLGLRLIELMTAQLKGEFSQEGPRWRFDFILDANL